jgi:single-strand DNA-binding protein
MSRSLNKVQLIGNIGSEPEIRVTPSGAKVAKLSLATNRVFQGRDGQQQDRTDWHRLTFFGKLADLVEQWVKKGDKLYVEGRLEYSQTQDEQGGPKYWTDIVVNEMMMLGSGSGGRQEGGDEGESFRAPRAGGGASGGSGGGGGGRGPKPIDPDDDLPF